MIEVDKLVVKYIQKCKGHSTDKIIKTKNNKFGGL